MKRIVITPWGGKHEHYLEECKASVVESGIEHLVVRCGTDWELRMFELRNEADYVAWVDADDIVYPGALQAAFELAESSQKGLVYTDEALIDSKSVEFARSTGDAKLFDIVMKPTMAHHLSLTKKNSVTERVVELHATTKVPLDWAMRVDAAINAGYVRLPIIGYGYRYHGEQIVGTPAFHNEFHSKSKEITTAFRKWAWPTGFINLND